MVVSLFNTLYFLFMHANLFLFNLIVLILFTLCSMGLIDGTTSMTAVFRQSAKTG